MCIRDRCYMQGLRVVVCPNLYRRRAASKNRSLIFSAHALDALPLFSARATCKPGALGSEESSPGAPAVTVLENTRSGRRPKTWSSRESEPQAALVLYGSREDCSPARDTYQRRS